MRFPRPMLLLVACAGIAASTLPSAAYAQPRTRETSNEARADAIFREALSAMNAHDYATAKDKFEASQKLAPGAGTLVNLGFCYEQLGQPAKAYRVYREAVALAEKMHRRDRAQIAIIRIDALKPKIALVDVVVVQPGVTISIDGTVVDEGTVPLDEGRHAFRATLEGHTPWSKEVVAKKGSRTEVVVPELAVDANASATASANGSGTASASPAASAHDAPPNRATATPAPTATPPSTPTDATKARRILGLSLAGLGVVGVSAGLVLGANAKSTYDQTSAHCNDQVCDAEGVDLTERAKTSATWSTVGIGAGTAALVGGLVLYFTTPSAATKIAPAATMTPNGFRAGVAAAF